MLYRLPADPKGPYGSHPACAGRPFEQVPERLRQHSEDFLAEHENILKAQRGDHMSLKQRQEASRAQFAFGFVRRREGLKVQQELVAQLTKLLLSEDGEHTALYAQLSLEQDLATGRSFDGKEQRHEDAIKKAAQLLASMKSLTQHAARGGGDAGGDTIGGAAGGAGGDESAAPQLSKTTSTSSDSSEASKPNPEVLDSAMQHKADAAGSDGGGSEVAGGETERCRLLALLTICRQMSDADIAKVTRVAGLTADAHLPVIRSMSYLGMPLLPLHRPAPPASGRVGDLEDEVVELGRYEPRLKALLGTALAQKLNPVQFPFVDADDAAEDAADPFLSPRDPFPSPRAELVGSWAFERRRRGGGAPTGSLASDRRDVAAAPPRLVILMLGGASYAELRCALDAGGGGKVGFGCTALLTPRQYLRTLQEAGGGYGDGVVEEQEEDTVPVLQGICSF